MLGFVYFAGVTAVQRRRRDAANRQIIPINTRLWMSDIRGRFFADFNATNVPKAYSIYNRGNKLRLASRKDVLDAVDWAHALSAT